MSTIEIRFAGFGGQGIVFASIVLARAASIYESRSVSQKDSKLEKKRDNIFAIQTQIYGPEARGGASRAEVMISENNIAFPHISEPDILVIMSEQAFEKYADGVKETTITLLDPTTVKSRPKNKFYEIPATKIADELGNKVVSNVVMLGALCAITGVVSKESLKKALIDKIHEKTKTINLNAFKKGFDLGKKLKKG